MNRVDWRRLSDAANPLGVKLGLGFTVVPFALCMVDFLRTGDRPASGLIFLTGYVFIISLLAARKAYVAGWEARSRTEEAGANEAA